MLKLVSFTRLLDSEVEQKAYTGHLLCYTALYWTTEETPQTFTKFHYNNISIYCLIYLFITIMMSMSAFG